MIPAGTAIKFKPCTLREQSQQPKRNGQIVATNDHGAFVRYEIVFTDGKLFQTKEFFTWRELAGVEVVCMGGLCE